MQHEAFAVGEFRIEVDGLDLGTEAFEDIEELGENGAGGVAVIETEHRQRVALVAHPRVESDVGVESSGAVLGFGVVETICLVFIAVVGQQVEVHDDLYLLRRSSRTSR